MLLKCQADVQFYNVLSRVYVVQESAWRCHVLTRVRRSRKCMAVSGAHACTSFKKVHGGVMCSHAYVVQESVWRCQVLTRVRRSRKCMAVSGAYACTSFKKVYGGVRCSRVYVVQESAWRCQVLTRVRRSRKCMAVSGSVHRKRVLSDWYVSTMVKYIIYLEL